VPHSSFTFAKLYLLYLLCLLYHLHSRAMLSFHCRTALKLVPHSSFTFAKLWLLAAKLEVRAKRLPAARKILGLALGSCPKGKLFKEYIQLEMTLGNIDRWGCRFASL
jgi:hypothetical protein